MLSHYHEVFSTDDLPVVKHFSPVRTFNLPENLDDVLQSLLTNERIERRGNEYIITPTGQRELDRGRKRWRFVGL